MIGCLRTRVRKQPIIALYFESENELKLYNLETWSLQFCAKDMLSAGAFIRINFIQTVQKGQASLNTSFWLNCGDVTMETRSRGYTSYFMFNSTEHELNHAH